MTTCLAYAEPDEASPGAPSALEDADLVFLAARGVAEALTEIHARHSSVLLALALRLLRNRQDAEEVLQDTFLYVWNKAAGYDPRRSSVATWLWLITRSRCLDQLRRRQRRGRLHSEIRREGTAAHLDPEGFGKVLRRERGDVLREAMDCLPEPQREVIELSFYRGLTQSEVASKVGIPLGTVKTRALLAKKKLRRELVDGSDLV